MNWLKDKFELTHIMAKRNTDQVMLEGVTRGQKGPRHRRGQRRILIIVKPLLTDTSLGWTPPIGDTIHGPSHIQTLHF